MWYAFDVAGVLVKERHMIRNGLVPVMMRMGMDVRYSEVKKAYTDYALGRISREEFWEVVPRHVEEVFLRGLEVSEEGKIVVKALKERGEKVGVITNLPGPWGREILERVGVEFDVVVISGEVGVKKPDPRIYEVFLEKVGVEPKDVVFVDDKLENLETAKDLGMKTAFFSWFKPDYVLDSLSEVLGI